MTSPRQRRIPGLRSARLVIASIGVGTVANSIAVVIAFSQVHAQVQAINVERARNITASCEQTNQRHDDTIAALDRTMLERLTGQRVSLGISDTKVRAELAAALKKAKPPLRRRAQQSLVATVLLIQALAPHQDCVVLVRRQVDTQ